MKNLILILTVFLASCATSNVYHVKSSFIDYSKFAKEGFFITEATSVNFEYQSVGSIIVESVSGKESTGKVLVKEFSSDGGVVEVQRDNLAGFKVGDLEDAFNRLYKDAISKGANGVINLKMNFQPAIRVGNEFYPSKWIVTGMLIKK